MPSMTSAEKIAAADLENLRIIRYGDRRLSEPATAVEDIDDSVRRLVDKMFELMFASSGVGLASPQVGITVQLFVASPTASPEDKRIYINPRIVSVGGAQQSEEGCLSIPGVTGSIRRYNSVTIEATDLAGRRFTETGTDLLARIFQHEMDHLAGRLIVDRMGSVARMAHRRRLKELAEGQEAPR